MATGDVLVIGNGSREHAFAWKLRQSGHVKRIYVASGNTGIHGIGENIAINPGNIADLCSFALEKDIDLTIVGTEMPLKLGIVDLFRANELTIFGPTAAAARVETSKLYAKDLMMEEGIPTAQFRTFVSHETAYAHIHQRGYPLVIKANGLAGGKGSYVCRGINDAEVALQELMVDRIYDEEGDIVIIEDFLEGEEISLHFLCHGTIMAPLITARDAKTLKEMGVGPNTGGMGTFAPVPRFTDHNLLHVEQTIVKPLLNVLNRRGVSFTGCLYPGLMLTADGPYVVEFNARFGDPETQPLMALMKGDLFLLLKSWAQGILVDPIFQNDMHAVCVVLCSKEYPLSANNPVPIYGIADAEALSDDITVFHGATKLVNSRLHTNGGRVLSVTATGKTLEEARLLTYRACEYIYFEGMQYREDIASHIN
ncbi:MAG: phosphoribosylamine--glycine ligase [bacterium]|nr:phosphoribosylamine--glycine ligase [bacterium]